MPELHPTRLCGRPDCRRRSLLSNGYCPAHNSEYHRRWRRLRKDRGQVFDYHKNRKLARAFSSLYNQ